MVKKATKERWQTTWCSRWICKAQIEPIRAKVKTEAKKVVEIMAKEYDIEDRVR